MALVKTRPIEIKGSSPAQTMSMDLLNQSKMKMRDR